ncbi:unnamed protein product [Cylindrotheca closterium]|uniref:Uncharacterized protein n=1 Tax=Cylindrotheca closterium TaxID=2856 RepID=A0AAD2CB85_9STRA|nr:unnamed protein product [Cylindrotheca closterium]
MFGEIFGRECFPLPTQRELLQTQNFQLGTMGKGQLLFKGDKSKKKKRKSKHSKKDEDSSTSTVVASKKPQSLDAPSLSAPVNPEIPSSSKANSGAMPTVKKGTGKITTSGTVVTGYDTRFMKEVSNGDAIMCNVKGQDELRVITIRLSDQSLNLSSAFSESLKHPVSFQYIRKPRDVAKEKKDALKKQKEAKQDLQQHAFDLYSGNGALVYREKTETGSYRIKRQEVSDANSRGDLLHMRAKKTSDKYC